MTLPVRAGWSAEFLSKPHGLWLSAIMSLGSGCASTTLVASPETAPTHAPKRLQGTAVAPRAGSHPVLESAPSDEVTRGESPWWRTLEAGIYMFDGEPHVLAVGDSKDHHHIAEGFLQAKVMARLGVRRAFESIQLRGTPNEPTLEDLFITRDLRVLALYAMRVPKDAFLVGTPLRLRPPEVLNTPGRHRIGRHVFESDRHLFLECDVEGPIANPDWGRTQAAARS